MRAAVAEAVSEAVVKERDRLAVDAAVNAATLEQLAAKLEAATAVEAGCEAKLASALEGAERLRTSQLERLTSTHEQVQRQWQSWAQSMTAKATQQADAAQRTAWSALQDLQAREAALREAEDAADARIADPCACYGCLPLRFLLGKKTWAAHRVASPPVQQQPPVQPPPLPSTVSMAPVAPPRQHSALWPRPSSSSVMPAQHGLTPDAQPVPWRLAHGVQSGYRARVPPPLRESYS